MKQVIVSFLIISLMFFSIGCKDKQNMGNVMLKGRITDCNGVAEMAFYGLDLTADKGTKYSAVTDENGNFSVEVAVGETLTLTTDANTESLWNMKISPFPITNVTAGGVKDIGIIKTTECMNKLVVLARNCGNQADSASIDIKYEDGTNDLLPISSGIFFDKYEVYLIPNKPISVDLSYTALGFYYYGVDNDRNIYKENSAKGILEKDRKIFLNTGTFSSTGTIVSHTFEVCNESVFVVSFEGISYTISYPLAIAQTLFYGFSVSEYVAPNYKVAIVSNCPAFENKASLQLGTYPVNLLFVGGPNPESSETSSGGSDASLEITAISEKYVTGTISGNFHHNVPIPPTPFSGSFKVFKDNSLQ